MKLQPPTSREDPNSKSKTLSRIVCNFWILELLWMLDVGAWILLSSTDRLLTSVATLSQTGSFILLPRLRINNDRHWTVVDQTHEHISAEFTSLDRLAQKRR